MAFYLINIALILFWRLFLTPKIVSNTRKCFCAIVALQWILLSGLRDWSVGADTYNYYTIFEQTKSISWGTIFGEFFNVSVQALYGIEKGYVAITKLFQLFSGSYQLFLIAIAVFFMTAMAVWIYRYSASPCTSFVLFSTLFYSFYAITGHRQTLATALVCFIGYDLIRRRKILWFAVVALIAFMIHKSSLIFTPIYFLSQVPVSMGYMLACAMVIALIAVLGKVLYGPIAVWLGYESLIDYAEGGAELYAVLLILLCAVIWAFYPRMKPHRQDINTLFHINSLALLSGFLVIQNQSFMRIQQYFSLFLMITIPEVINTVKREHRLLVYLLFGAVMIAYLIIQNPQYKFFFMD